MKRPPSKGGWPRLHCNFAASNAFDAGKSAKNQLANVAGERERIHRKGRNCRLAPGFIWMAKFRRVAVRFGPTMCLGRTSCLLPGILKRYNHDYETHH